MTSPLGERAAHPPGDGLVSQPRSGRRAAATWSGPALALIAALGLAACGPTDGGGRTPAAPTAFASELLAPLDGLPACERVSPPATVPPPPGLILPGGAVLATSTRTGTVVQVRGYVELTPVQVLAALVGRGDLEIEQAEHEVVESEVTYTTAPDGRPRRVFLKAQAVCATGSDLIAIVGTPDDAVPTPSGAG